MHLGQLKLWYFRNYLSESSFFHPDVNIIYGRNAQGKTNILEAIYLLSTLRPLHSIENRDLIYMGQNESFIEGVFIDEGSIGRKLSIHINEHRRQPRINDKTIKKSADYFGLVHVISFNPLDLQILQGAPFHRRRYLDRAIFNCDASYAMDIGKYHRALLQRNAALRLENKDQVSLWGEKMHRLGAKVLLKRLQFVSKLNNLTPCLYREISGSDQDVKVHYESDVAVKDSEIMDEEDFYHLLEKKQQKVLVQEERVKRSLVGPHRDDFSVRVAGYSLRSCGSQGEQRTAVLSLKLSEWIAVEQEKEVKPIFLLDDIASELDETRRGYLFNSLQERKTQVFITTTDIKDLKMNLFNGALFYVENGSIKPS